MTKKRTLLVVLAIVLVCAVSVMGTLAYLNAVADPVVNTFVAADAGEDFVGDLTLCEYLVETNAAGLHVEDKSQTTAANLYDNVLPGTSLPKTVIVSVEDKSTAPGYLYVEIASQLDASVYSWDVTANWLPLAVTGKNGGTVYVYSVDGVNPAVITADLTVEGVLADNAIAVANTTDLKLSNDPQALTTMKIYAYLSQSTVNSTSDPAEVYDVCFN